MYTPRFDDVDLTLLQFLQKHGRMKRNQLGEEVNLSVPTISERMRKLEEAGVISGYHAVLNARKVGLEVTAFIFLSSESSKFYHEIIEKAVAEAEILECHAITGDGSHVLKVRTRSTASLEKLLSRIQSWPGVVQTRTDIVLSSHKETTEVPLAQLKKHE